MPNHRPPGAFRRHPRPLAIDTSSDAILYAIFIEAPQHLYHLALLLAALFGALVLQCLILVWIALYIAQVRVFLLSARVLQKAFPPAVMGEREREDPNATLKRDVGNAHIVKEVVLEGNKARASFELPATPVDEKVNRIFAAEAANSPVRGAGTGFAGPVEDARTLDKLRDAARASGRRRATSFRGVSPVSDLEEEETEPEAAAPPPLNDGGMIDWGAMTARETDAEREMLRLTLDQGNGAMASDGHDQQPDHQRRTENNPPLRPIVRLPNDRPPRPKPAVAASHPNMTYAQVAVQTPPQQAVYGAGHPLNRSSAFTQEQLAAAKNFMSTATRKGGTKPGTPVPRQQQRSHAHPAQFLANLRKDRDNIRLKEQQALKQSLNALQQSKAVPSKPVDRPLGWIPPHIAAAASKAARNSATAREVNSKDTVQNNSSEGGDPARSDSDNDQDDHPDDSEQRIDDTWPTWQGDSAIDSQGDASLTFVGADLLAEPVHESDPPVPVLDASIPSAGFDGDGGSEVEATCNEELSVTEAQDDLLVPLREEESAPASPEAASEPHKPLTGCSPARLKLFAGREDAGGIPCAMCNRTAVNVQDAICFPCSTVEDRIDDVKELLAPYTARLIEAQEAARRQTVKARPTHIGARKYGKSWSSESRKDEAANGSSPAKPGFENTLLTVEVPETVVEETPPSAKDCSYDHPDLSDLTSGLSEQTTTVKPLSQAYIGAQSRKLSANAPPFFATYDFDLQAVKPSSATNRTLSPVEDLLADLDADVGVPTSPDSSFKSRPGSSLSDSRWAPKKAITYGQQHPMPGSRAIARTTPDLDTVFGPALPRAQSDTAQLFLPTYPPAAPQMRPQRFSSAEAQADYMLHHDTNSTHPVSAVEEQLQAFQAGSMRLPPGLPVPEHLKKSLRLSKAIPITKPVETSERTVQQGRGPFSAPAASENADRHSDSAMDRTVTALFAIPDIEEKVGNEATTPGAGRAWTDKKVHDPKVALRETSGNQSKPDGEKQPLVAGAHDPMIRAVDPVFQGAENVPPARSQDATIQVKAGDSKTTNSTTITKPGRLRKIAREAIVDAFRARDEIRVQLLGSWNLEKAQEFEAATEVYNGKRNELAAISQEGKLSEEDAKSFPELSATHVSPPKVRATKSRRVSRNPDRSPIRATGSASAAANSSSPERQSSSPENTVPNGSAPTDKTVTDATSHSKGTAAQVEAQVKARNAYDLLVAAMTAWQTSMKMCPKCAQKSCGDHLAAKGKSRIGPAKTNYRRRREALVQAYSGELPIWLATALPDPQELELRHEKEQCCVC